MVENFKECKKERWVFILVRTFWRVRKIFFMAYTYFKVKICVSSSVFFFCRSSISLSISVDRTPTTWSAVTPRLFSFLWSAAFSWSCLQTQEHTESANEFKTSQSSSDLCTAFLNLSLSPNEKSIDKVNKSWVTSMRKSKKAVQTNH